MPESMITKRALGASMKELMATRRVGDITVGDICASCGMNRKSLYYHFEDKYALLNWIFYTELIEPLDSHTFGDIWELLLAVAKQVHRDRAFYSQAFGMEGASHFRAYFSECLRPYMLGAVAGRLPQSRHFDMREKEDACAEFLADAVVLSLEKWIVQYPQLPAEHYVDLFRH